jgi:tetratricopeptide (TPR) repeat protein
MRLEAVKKTCAGILLGVVFLAASNASSFAYEAKNASVGIQITTKSPQARSYFLDGLWKFQRLHIQDGLTDWRQAVKKDPNFTLAHIFLSNFSADAAEQVAERDKALATRASAGPEEQLIVDWLSNSSKGQWIPAIQAMNEVRMQFPQDKQVYWLSGNWLTAQQEWGRAIAMYEQAIKIDPQFADAWNSAAYCYARTRQFDKAFVSMKKYTELLPNESNPQDSFAEISRMAGRYDEALQHYRESLKIDHGFIESQLGIGDTYALMGDEAKAREEYAIAIDKAREKVEKAQWMLQSAATYVREGKIDEADQAFMAIAKQCHENEMGNLEADAYRQMALYQTNSARAKELLDKAKAVTQEKHAVPKSVLDQEIASILRTRVERAISDADMKAASAGVKQLETVSNASSDAAVKQQYASAAGALAVAQGRYQDAIALLEDADRDPVSMQHLVVAYEKAGQKESAEQVARNLAAFNEPVLEQAVVVVPFRKSHPAMTASTK